LDERNGGPLTALHVSKRGIFRLGFQNLGETLLGVLLGRNGTRLPLTWDRIYCAWRRPNHW